METRLGSIGSKCCTPSPKSLVCTCDCAAFLVDGGYLVACSRTCRIQTPITIWNEATQTNEMQNTDILHKGLKHRCTKKTDYDCTFTKGYRKLEYSWHPRGWHCIRHTSCFGTCRASWPMGRDLPVSRAKRHRLRVTLDRRHLSARTL